MKTTVASWSGSPHPGFAMTPRRSTVGRTPLDELSARRRDLYLTTYNTQKRQAFRPPAGFETAIPASERQQTHALDRGPTGIGSLKNNHMNYFRP